MLTPGTICILVIIAFWVLVIHAIHLEEKRTSVRRQMDLPRYQERRRLERRRNRPSFTRFEWVIKGLWLRLRGQERR